MKPDRNFWRGKNVLVTGHSGFKGGWLALWLYRMGANISGISLPPNTTPNIFELAKIGDCCENHFCDIRDNDKLTSIIKKTNPEVIFHLAAQPLVRSSYKEPLITFSTNIIGTANVLDALRNISSTRVGVIITTDKVYRNNEWRWPYREEDVLGGHDPYSASKAACEIVIDSYRKSFFNDQGIALASARAGNVIGGGDWSKDRLIPDAVRAWQSDSTLQIRRPDSIRPWQHVLEPLSGYLILAQTLWENPNIAGAYNFGPLSHQAATVREVIELAKKSFGSGKIQYEDGIDGPHEAGWLALEIAKSTQILGFQPRFSIESAVEQTMSWYKAQHDGTDARQLCDQDFASYELNQ